jgi:mRNA-degrading endonuclease toxin of MazEF toxin-antitoxin module
VTSRVKGYPFEVALPEAGGVNGVVLADQQIHLALVRAIASSFCGQMIASAHG